MALALGDYDAFQMLAGQGDLRLLVKRAAIGATGAVSSTVGDQGITIARNTTGVYDVTVPPVPSGAFSAVIPIVISSASETVTKGYVTAYNRTTGVATVNFAASAATQADPASGDHIGILFIGSLLEKQ